MTFRLLVTDDLSPQAVELLDNEQTVEFDVIKGLTPEGLAALIEPYDGLIVRSSVNVTAGVVDAAPRLRVVGRAGVGVDNIDIEAASRRGVVVMNTPGANTVAAAEHTVALLLALCRHVPQAAATLKTGEWDRKRFRGIELRGKTIGIVGLGRIGRRVVRRCQAFGMKIIGYDPYLSDERLQEMKIERASLDELYADSDFVSLHAALTSDTTRLIDADAIARMKPGVRIINTSRGALIDESALIAGLRTGKIAGAALDVFDPEPPAPDNPLLAMDNVVATPHLAASTEEAQHEVGIQVVEEVLDALRDIEYRNAVNLPMVDGSVLNDLRPFLQLAEKVGSMQTQLADGAIARVEVGVEGDLLDEHIKLVTVAILKGALEPLLAGPVNYVNASFLAKERGITIAQTSGLHSVDYPNMISCRVQWEGGARTVAATVFSHNEPRIVDMDGFRVDVKPEGIMLIALSHDEPGFIGKVGTLLGESDINIGGWRTGRDLPGGTQLSFISVDSEVPDNVVDLLANTPPIERITRIEL